MVVRGASLRGACALVGLWLLVARAISGVDAQCLEWEQVTIREEHRSKCILGFPDWAKYCRKYKDGWLLAGAEDGWTCDVIKVNAMLPATILVCRPVMMHRMARNKILTLLVVAVLPGFFPRRLTAVLQADCCPGR